MIYTLAAIVCAYLLGSIPTAYIFGRLLKGIDIREHGSGNVGATNVFRTMGKGAGIAVFALDFAKGLIAVTVLPMFFQRMFPGSGIWSGEVFLLLGASAITGHIWTVFLRFKGGKGVATTAGVMAGLAPLIMAAGLIIWVAVFSIWRYVSFASIVAALSLPVMSVIFGRDIVFTLFCSILCIIGIYSHRSNIKRLLTGTEKKI